MKFSCQKYGPFPRCPKNFIRPKFSELLPAQVLKKKVSILHIVGIVLLGTMMDSDQRICFLLSVLVTLWREYLIIKLLQVPFSICSGKYFDQKLTVTHICARLQGQRLSFFLMLSSFPFITMRN